MPFQNKKVFHKLCIICDMNQNMTYTHAQYNYNYCGEQGSHSGESARLPPLWPGFNCQTWRHMWIEFIVGFSPGSPVGSCILWEASIVLSVDISVDASVDMSVATRSSIGRYSAEISADSRSSIG